jgi:predicted secreted protein
MTTNAQIGHGTLFYLADASSPTSYSVLAEVTSITPPALARDAIDASHTQSPNAWREFVAGMKDGGEVSLELNFIPGSATTTRILETFSQNVSILAKIVFPDSPGTTWSFEGIITGFEAEAPVDDKMSASLTFKVSGQPSFV